MLEVGTKAPDFTLPDQNGDNISISDFLGKKVVLWFFPRASTPGWTTEGLGFRDELKNFKEKNMIVIGMSADSSKKQKNFCDKQDFQYLMLSDEQKDTLKAYKTWVPKKMYGREYEGIARCTYIIDEKGIIEKTYHKVSVKTHAKDILEEF